MDRYQYLILMALCLLITLPLELVFGARVWRRPRRLALSLLPVVVLFSVWDVVAIGRRHWTYADRYTTGWTTGTLGDLPIEELVFFVVIPICSLLTLEAVRGILGGRRG